MGGGEVRGQFGYRKMFMKFVFQRGFALFMTGKFSGLKTHLRKSLTFRMSAIMQQHPC